MNQISKDILDKIGYSTFDMHDCMELVDKNTKTMSDIQDMLTKSEFKQLYDYASNVCHLNAKLKPLK